MNLGLESLTYTARSSYTEDISSVARLCELDSAIEHLSSYITDLAYAYDNITAMRIAVRKYGCTESLSYLFGENFASMEDDNETGSAKEGIFKRMWNAIVRYLKIFWDWIVSLFNNTKTIIKNLKDAKPNCKALNFPITINGIIPYENLEKYIKLQTEELKNLKDSTYKDFEINKDDPYTAGQAYDAGRATLKEAYNRQSVKFSTIDPNTNYSISGYMYLEREIDAHINALNSIEQAVSIVKELRNKFKDEIRSERNEGKKVKSTYMKGILVSLRTYRTATNLFCSSARALLRGINSSLKHAAKASK